LHRSSQKNNIRSLKGEKLKSFEECQIANFLALNGIEYQYEANYQHNTATSRHRQYKPEGTSIFRRFPLFWGNLAA